MRPSVEETLTIRGATCGLRRWAAPGAPRLLMLHGWQDCSASFQFVVDALQGTWDVFAPDRRGTGLSHAVSGELYAITDLLADIDAVMAHCSANTPVRLVAHSMGANAAMLYAAARPERVAGLVNLEGFGSYPSEGPCDVRRLAVFLSKVREGVAPKRYAGVEECADRLMRSNPRLAPDRAIFIAKHLGQTGDDAWVSSIDPWHQIQTPVTGGHQLFMEAFTAIACPMRLLSGADSAVLSSYRQFPQFEERLRAMPTLDHREIADCGHNMHHDQPEAVAAMVEDFFAGLPPI